MFFFPWEFDRLLFSILAKKKNKKKEKNTIFTILERSPLRALLTPVDDYENYKSSKFFFPVVEIFGEYWKIRFL